MSVLWRMNNSPNFIQKSITKSSLASDSLSYKESLSTKADKEGQFYSGGKREGASCRGRLCALNQFEVSRDLMEGKVSTCKMEP